MNYFSDAYFIYNDDSKYLVEEIENNEFGTQVTSIYVDDFIDDIVAVDNNIKHVILSVLQEKAAKFLEIAYKYNLSIGIIPLPSQKEQIKNLYASDDIKENIEIAFRDDCQSIDLVEINGDLVYSQGVIGTVPLVGEKLKKIRSSFFKTFIYSIKKFFSIELQKFEITTHNGQKIITAGSAIVILNHTKNGLISKIFDFNQSMRDNKITMVIISPYSIFEYIKLLSSIFQSSKEGRNLPKSIGYIQSESFTIKASSSKRMNFDNAQSLELPIECKIVAEAIKLNASEEFWLINEKASSTKETLKIANIPDSNEATKYMSQHIPLFKSASEDRFKELFQILRVDAKTNLTYLVLMILSTLLASFGLFSNSTAVIIGAMLVAPLMVPIVSISMGLLRADTTLIIP